MIKKVYLFGLAATIVLLSSCEKDSTDTKENFIKATINSELFLAYADNALNIDTVPNTFSFTFGQSITTLNDVKDTCLIIRASLNHHNLQISFPKTSNPQVFGLYREASQSSRSTAFYHEVPHYVGEKGFVVYYTQTPISDPLADKKVGEIKVTRIDWKSCEVEGTFSFIGEGFETVLTETIQPTDKKITVTNGEFYYHWSNELFQQ